MMFIISKIIKSSKDDLYDEAVALVIREEEQVLHLFKGI